MRRTLVLAAVVLTVAPGRAQAADVVTLLANRGTVGYGGRITLSGTIAPAVPGETVGIYVRSGGAWSLVANATTAADGTFARSLKVKKHVVYVARGATATGTAIDSAPVSVRVRPRVVTYLHGSKRLAAHLYVTGRVRPRAAGTVTVTEGDRTSVVRTDRTGFFRFDLTTTRLYAYRATVRLRPASGYVGWHRTRQIRVKLPSQLAVGARGPAVRWLEYSLARLHHFALPSIDAVYDYATVDAVLAFQSIHGLPRTGVVDRRFWDALARSGLPHARIPFGDHIEVDKTRQVLFEVRAGAVAFVAHVSTGATGNTPVGHWHVYAKQAGYTPKMMYDSLFFIGGFAIHGYYSVPAYPASHGCVRAPLWFAPAIFARWGVGTSVFVFA